MQASGVTLRELKANNLSTHHLRLCIQALARGESPQVHVNNCKVCAVCSLFPCPVGLPVHHTHLAGNYGGGVVFARCAADAHLEASL